MRYIAIVQARAGSARLPGKVFLEVAGKPLLEYSARRLKLSKKIDKIVVATTINPEDDQTEALCQKIGIDCFRGSVNDVLGRYVACLKEYPEYNGVVRITGDCPLIDPQVVDRVVEFFEAGGYDYAGNVNPPTFPDGMDTEVFTRKALEVSNVKATTDYEKEHVDEYVLQSDEFKKGNYAIDADYASYRLTVDNPEDFKVIKFLIENTAPDATYLDYIKLLDEHPEIKKINSHIGRNEGAQK